MLCTADANKMFIQLSKPHESVSSQTLAHWMTNIMADAGLESEFAPDSTIFAPFFQVIDLCNLASFGR